MHLSLSEPSRVLIDQPVQKISAEASHGCFTLLPHHVDVVICLIPGILTFHGDTDRETFIAIDEGILVKQQSRVMVCVRQALQGDSLETLRSRVGEQFRVLDERERMARTILVKLQTSFVHTLLQVGGGGGGT